MLYIFAYIVQLYLSAPERYRRRCRRPGWPAMEAGAKGERPLARSTGRHFKVRRANFNSIFVCLYAFPKFACHDLQSCSFLSVRLCSKVFNESSWSCECWAIRFQHRERFILQGFSRQLTYLSVRCLCLFLASWDFGFSKIDNVAGFAYLCRSLSIPFSFPFSSLFHAPCVTSHSQGSANPRLRIHISSMVERPPESFHDAR